MAYQIGVMGSAGGEKYQSNMDAARAIGEEIAIYGGVLINGACGGLPGEALLGAKSRDGLTVGISPALNRQEHIEVYKMPVDADAMIYTGMHYKGRNLPNIRSCDAVILIGGRIGTLNEFTIGYDEGKVCGVLEGTGDLSDKFREIIETAQKEGGTMIYNDQPKPLIQEVFRELKETIPL